MVDVEVDALTHCDINSFIRSEIIDSVDGIKKTER
jgi:hypothetical protein